MIKIGNISLGNMPRIALALNDEINENCIKDIKAQGVDIIEIRIDQFNNVEKNYVKKTINSIIDKGLPVIATIRSRKEGGKKDIPDNQRLELFNDIIPLVDAIDIELESDSISEMVIQKAHANKKIVIVSYHNFENTPSDVQIEMMIEKAKKIGGDIVKIATQANNKEDAIKLLNILLKHKDKNIIAISLGESGTISRVFFPFAGSLLTYTYISNPSSIGQIPLTVLQDKLRFFYPQYNEMLITNLELMENI